MLVMQHLRVNIAGKCAHVLLEAGCVVHILLLHGSSVRQAGSRQVCAAVADLMLLPLVHAGPSWHALTANQACVFASAHLGMMASGATHTGDALFLCRVCCLPTKVAHAVSLCRGPHACTKGFNVNPDDAPLPNLWCCVRKNFESILPPRSPPFRNEQSHAGA